MSEQPEEQNDSFETLFRKLLKCRDEYHKLYMKFIDLNTDRDFISAPLPIDQNMKASSISYSKADLNRMNSKELMQLIKDNELLDKLKIPAEKNDLVDILDDYYRNRTSKGGKHRSTKHKKINKRRRSSKRHSLTRKWFPFRTL